MIRTAILIGLLLGLLAGSAAASTPGTNGAVLFSQARCPDWAARRCVALPQACAVDSVTQSSFAADLPNADAVLSPDGRQVAWDGLSGGSLRLLVAAADGSGRRVLADADSTAPGLSWSPDGTRIAFVGATPLNPAPLQVVDVAAGSVRELARGVFEPSWSPDGSEIAVDSPVPVGSIVALDPATGKGRSIADGGASQPDWSPDGTRLALTDTVLGVPPEVQVVSRDGSDRHGVTPGSWPAWSPDGTSIAFVRDTGIWTTAAGIDAPRELSATPHVSVVDTRWLTAGQTASLRPNGSCDLSVDENDSRTEGGPGVDTILVTAVRTEVYGNGGNDLFWTDAMTAAGPVRLDGGAGDDDFELYGGRSTVLGGTGNDRVDALFDGVPLRVDGGPGADWVRAGIANDSLAGGPGADRLYGEAGNDRIAGGTGRDLIAGGPGNDVLLARDGERDTIRCGSGRDVAEVDRRDTVARDCERVIRR